MSSLYGLVTDVQKIVTKYIGLNEFELQSSVLHT